MKTLMMHKYGKEHPMTFELASYAENGNLYVGLITHEEGYPEPWQNLTVNLSRRCEDNRAFIDTNNNGNAIVNWLLENNLGHLTGRMANSGFCTYPEFEFNMETLLQYVMEGDNEYEN